MHGRWEDISILSVSLLLILWPIHIPATMTNLFLVLLPCNIPTTRLQLLFFWLPLYLIFFSCIDMSSSTTSSTSKFTTAATTEVALSAATFFSNETDRLSLLAFKAGIIVDPTRGLSSWNETLHFCDGWRGVTCGRRHRQRVVALDLHSLGLTGYISSSIANLTFLREINLSNNQLYGVIPLKIGRLFRLRHLNLNNNSLVGEIPSSLSHCFDLQLINLGKNKLTGEIPVGLGYLPKLRGVFLETNKLSGVIPPSLGNLSSSHFLFLELGDNGFRGVIPPEMGRLAGLWQFSVYGNQLSGMVPASLYNNLSLIQVFDLSSNRLSGTIPPDVGITLPNLWIFTVYGNMFEGPIPNSISNASLLIDLNFSENKFSGTIPGNLGALKKLYFFSVAKNQLEARGPSDWNFLTSLTNCTHLSALQIHNNKLEGVLPNSIANLSTGLKSLNMGGNRISGNIPVGIENLVDLKLLAMHENHLTGNVPAALGKLQGLSVLDLSANELSGEIPSALGNITQLFKLCLQFNYLWGNIPTSFENFQHLKMLNLAKNNLSGIIPDQVLSLFSLSIYLDLSDNSFSGSLSVKVGRLINLGILYLSGNKLSGEIPSTLGDCQRLDHLSLHGNYFRGPVPLSLRNLRGIQVLDLSLNNLSGRIPEFLGDFRFLEFLNLSFNNFEGEVPRNGVFTNASAISLVGNNKLCGDIPRLHLIACPSQVQKRKGSHSLRIIIISVVVVGFCLLLLLIFMGAQYRMRKLRNRPPPSMPSLNNKYRKVSYNELLKATDGFSSTNLIGMGSFSSVYKGTLDGDTTDVAVKVLNLQRRGASKSFTAECEALINIRHRNLVKIVTTCSSVDFKGDDFKALIFEFMPNGSLEKWLHPEVNVQGQLRTLDFVQRLSITIDVASALDYLHNHCHLPIVHCDLKPNNVLLDDDMNARVSDFGLARFLCEATSKNSENPSSSIGIKGSVGYVAPEYGLGGPVSTYGDAYSFGILLLEMFTAKKPIDDMFKDGLSLRTLVETSLPEQVMHIADPRLVSQDEGEEAPCRTSIRSRMQKCLISMMRIGLMCTKESPRERMQMRDVVTEMYAIKGVYLGQDC